MPGAFIRVAVAVFSCFLIQVLGAAQLGFLPVGTRAQAAGAAWATATLLLSGYLVGLTARGPGGALGILTDASRVNRLAELKDVMSPWSPAPWPRVAACIGLWVALGLAGSVGVFESILLQADGDAMGAAWAANTYAAPIYCALGALLGANTKPWTFIAGFGGAAFFLAGGGLVWWIARQISYEPTIVAAIASVGAMLWALVTGFVISWARGRLGFVEHVLAALIVGYIAFLTIAAGPAVWTENLNLPQEQVFLSLALFPTVLLGALITVGGSLAFLLFGSGRFDPSFHYERRLALRYLSAHRKDGFVGIVTVISVLGVCLGVMALIVVLSIMSGFEEDTKRKILGAHAHLQVTKKGADFTQYIEIEKRLSDIDGVTSVGAYVLGDAMISTDVGTSGTLVKGIDPNDEDAVAELSAIVEKGQFEYLSNPEDIPGARPRLRFPPPPLRTSSTADIQGAYDPAVPVARDVTRGRVLPGILLGRELSRSLRAYVGDTVKLVSPASEEIGPLGPTPKLRRFRVAGIFYAGMYEYDAKFTYLEMKQAQRFLGMRKRASGIEMKVDDIDDTARLEKVVSARIGGFPYEVRDWRAMNKELFSALLLEKIAMFVALGMIVMVASFLIVAVLVMTVLKRRREIAVLKSLGASDSSVMKIFVVQGLLLGVGGGLLGGTLGVLTCVLIRKFVRLDPRIFYIDRLPVVMDGREIAIIAISAIIMSYLATIYPAVTAARHPPVEGLRDE